MHVVGVWLKADGNQNLQFESGRLTRLICQSPGLLGKAGAAVSATHQRAPAPTINAQIAHDSDDNCLDTHRLRRPHPRRYLRCRHRDQL